MKNKDNYPEFFWQKMKKESDFLEFKDTPNQQAAPVGLRGTISKESQ